MARSRPLAKTPRRRNTRARIRNFRVPCRRLCAAIDPCTITQTHEVRRATRHLGTVAVCCAQPLVWRHYWEAQMLRRTYTLASISFAFFTLGAMDASATAQRTFVASYGLPANTAFNCSIAKPCRAFSEALSVTTAGGELIVLDSAGNGPVSITNSVSIVAAPGIYAGVTAFSGNGINVHGAGISVALKGLKINGQGGDTGIDFDLGAKLIIEDCEVSNFASI